MGVYSKLQKIQSELKAPKTQYNNFGKYNYRNCEDILEALKPLLAENQSVITISDEIEQKNDRYYIKATVTFIDCESGETVNTTAYAREALDKKGMDESQLTGATSSYARKYALNGMFAIDDSKDSDYTNTGEENKKKNNTGTEKTVEYRGKKIIDSNKEKLTVLVKEFKIVPKEITERMTKLFKKTKAEELTNAEFKKLEGDIINFYTAKEE